MPPIRCASHVLGMQFHRITGALMGDTVFEAFSKITRVAEELENWKAERESHVAVFP